MSCKACVSLVHTDGFSNFVSLDLLSRIQRNLDDLKRELWKIALVIKFSKNLPLAPVRGSGVLRRHKSSVHLCIFPSSLPPRIITV